MKPMVRLVIEIFKMVVKNVKVVKKWQLNNNNP
jgi:hypothetical protein